MSNESTYVRRLEEGEPDEPTSAVIHTVDGRRIACLLTRKDPSTWTAQPPEPHRFQDGDRFLIDRLPAGAAVEFIDVIGPDTEG